jgi:outer membrane lipoprotein-sorting protein
MSAPDDLDIDLQMEQQLESLSRSLPEAPGFVPAVMSRIAAEAVQPVVSHFYKRWIMKASIGLAASVMIGAFLWTLFPGSHPVYGMSDLPQRLLTVDTLHLKGTIYSPNGHDAGHPIEIFLERPDRVRVNGYMAYGPTGATSLMQINNPKQKITVDDSRKSVVISPSTPVDQRMSFEQMFQMEVVTLMLGPSPDNDFRKLRSESLGGVMTDVYQSTTKQDGLSARMMVWLDPATGLPRQARAYMRFGTKPEQLVEDIDTIEAGVPIPDGTFEYQAPADYTVTQSDVTPVLESGVAGNTDLEVRFVFDLDHRGVLMCWREFNPSNPAIPYDPTKDHANTTFRSEKGVQYAEQVLHTDPVAGGAPWRWSLLTPVKPTAPDDDALIVAVGSGGGQLSLGLRPVQMNPDDLKLYIEQAQGLTMPPGATPVPLEQLEDQLAK